MNRKKFTGLIIMMLLSVIGIIWVQIVWIRNAVNIQNESFNNAVRASLENAANAIEASRKMSFFNNFMLTDPFAFNDTSNDISGYFSFRSYSTDPAGNISLNITNHSGIGNADTAHLGNLNKSLIINGDTARLSDSVAYIVASPDNGGKMKIVKKGDEAVTNSRSVYMRQNEFLDWVKKKSNEFQNLSDQMISEIYQWEKTLELDNKEVGYTLNQALTFSQIETPYEYAIIKNGVVQDGTYKKADKKDFLKSRYMVRLFPDNIIGQDLILSVIFPERTNYVLGSMALILGRFIDIFTVYSCYLCIKSLFHNKAEEDI